MYGPEGAKSAGGSISLGLPRQQDPAKPGEKVREGAGAESLSPEYLVRESFNFVREDIKRHFVSPNTVICK